LIGRKLFKIYGWMETLGTFFLQEITSKYADKKVPGASISHKKIKPKIQKPPKIEIPKVDQNCCFHHKRNSTKKTFNVKKHVLHPKIK
jgi:hypothetical protein